MSADAVYLVAGLALFVGVLAPVLVRSIALSAPMVLLLLGMVIGLLPMPEGWSLDPVAGRKVIEHVTEVAVLVALMGVGLALDRPLTRRTWRSWSPTWRLLISARPRPANRSTCSRNVIGPVCTGPPHRGVVHRRLMSQHHGGSRWPW